MLRVCSIRSLAKDFMLINTNWKNIWNNRAIDHSQINLQTLINLDGFDSGAGKINAIDWSEYTKMIIELLHIENSDSVYEVGCGSGALLYSISEHIKIRAGGNDYSESLINVAKEAFQNPDDFSCTEASLISTSPQFDYTISNAVFHYFSKEHASIVLEKMILKARKGIAILEIPDLNTKEMSEEFRRGALPKKVYDNKYKGLEHTYYDRGWFSNFANSLGYSVQIFDGFVPNYSQNKYRFGCIINKRRR